MEGLYRKVLSSCRVTSNPKRFLGEALKNYKKIVGLGKSRRIVEKSQCISILLFKIVENL